MLNSRPTFHELVLKDAVIHGLVLGYRSLSIMIKNYNM